MVQTSPPSTQEATRTTWSDARGPYVWDARGRRLLDLTSAGGATLLGHHPHAVAAAVHAGTMRAQEFLDRLPHTRRDIERLLRRVFPGAERVVYCNGAGAARETAARVARSRGGRAVVVEATHGAVLSGPTRHVPPGDILGVERALEEGDVAAIVLEPVTPGVFSLRDLKWLRELATRHDALLVFDESSTAFRLATGSVAAMSGVRPDLTCVGEALASGAPFGAVLGPALLLDDLYGRDSAPGTAPSPEAMVAARATLEELSERPVAERLREVGERLRAAFERACREFEIRATLFGPAARMHLHFRGQENADSELIARVFQEELTNYGLAGGDLVLPNAAMDDEAVEEAARGLHATVARIRTLLIEHNSYLSGGVPYVFPTQDALLAERGLAVYRFPALADVEVAPSGEGMRIAFAPADLGKVTSSGFYVPTRVRGDFTVVARYRLGRWSPAGDSASLGLFAQDEPSERRYYAQRRSDTGGRRHEVLGNLAGKLFEPTPVRDGEGWFRLQRRGGKVTSWHRAVEEPDWRLLGEHQEDSPRDMIVGAKIWSSGPCEGLEAEILDLSIEAEIPADQPPHTAVRPDPRKARPV